MKEHVRQRGKTWAYWIENGKDENGRRRQLTKGGFASEAEAHAAARKLMVKIDDEGTYTAPTKELLESFFERWHKTLHLKPSTLAMYSTLMRAHIIPGLGQVAVRRLTAAQLNTFYADLLLRGRRHGKAKGTGLAPITVHKIHALIHKALAAGVKWGDLPRNVAEQADPPSGQSQSEMRVWTAEQVGVFLDSVASDRLSSIYLLLATTGLRRGEALGLRWKDIDLTKGRLSVVQTVITVNYKVQYSTPKTAAGRRSVALATMTVEAIKGHRVRQVAERTSLGLPWPTSDSLVFSGLAGEPLHPDGFSDRFDRLVKSAGLPKISVHDLRHTHATLALQAGIAGKVVSDRLGHATVATTLDTYSHVIPQMQEDAAELVAALLFSAKRAR